MHLLCFLLWSFIINLEPIKTVCVCIFDLELLYYLKNIITRLSNITSCHCIKNFYVCHHRILKKLGDRIDPSGINKINAHTDQECTTNYRCCCCFHYIIQQRNWHYLFTLSLSLPEIILLSPSLLLFTSLIVNLFFFFIIHFFFPHDLSFLYHNFYFHYTVKVFICYVLHCCH